MGRGQTSSMLTDPGQYGESRTRALIRTGLLLININYIITIIRIYKVTYSVPYISSGIHRQLLHIFPHGLF